MSKIFNFNCNRILLTGEDAVLSKTTSSSVKSLPVVQSDSSCDESISSFHENSKYIL